MEFKAVLFDLDGTLLYTLEDLANSMNSVLQSMGFPTHPVEKYRYFVGNGMYNLVKRAVPPEIKEETVLQHCLTKMKEEYGRRWAETTRPYDGIIELLDELDLLGVKKSVLSNKPDDMTKIIIRKFFPNGHFVMVEGQKEGVPKKPDPTAALKISRQMGILPANFLYLGDSNTDMQTATSAGMYPVGALWGFREEKELLESGARVLVKHPLELINLI